MPGRNNGAMMLSKKILNEFRHFSAEGHGINLRESGSITVSWSALLDLLVFVNFFTALAVRAFFKKSDRELPAESCEAE